IIIHRKSTANNKYMKNYNANKPSKYINYLDENNLYGWAMSQSLPYGGFEWIDPKEYQLNNMTTDSSFGYILEVDLEYPKDLHDSHSDYPFCPEHVLVTNEMLSKYQVGLAEKHEIKCSKIKKLMPTLRDKEKYILHERNLKQAIDAGLALKTV